MSVGQRMYQIKALGQFIFEYKYGMAENTEAPALGLKLVRQII